MVWRKDIIKKARFIEKCGQFRIVLGGSLKVYGGGRVCASKPGRQAKDPKKAVGPSDLSEVIVDVFGECLGGFQERFADGFEINLRVLDVFFNPLSQKDFEFVRIDKARKPCQGEFVDEKLKQLLDLIGDRGCFMLIPASAWKIARSSGLLHRQRLVGPRSRDDI